MPTNLPISRPGKRAGRFVTIWALVTIFFGAAAGAGASFTVLCLGDSLTAGYGLDPSQAYPQLLEEALRADGLDATVINGGLSGETSAGGLRRVKWVLRRPVDVLVLALGANDGLRGVPPASTRANLQAIIDAAREAQPGIEILLAGMLAPPNMGTAYASAFAGIYPELAASNDLRLLPFLLEGVAGEPTLNQADGIHPNVEGQQRVARLVLRHLEPFLPSTGAPAGENP